PAVKVFTVATEDTHGLQRFLRSTKMHGIDVEILGMGQKWDGGNMKNPGGGQKVKLLKQKILSMQKLPDREQIIIFTDSERIEYSRKPAHTLVIKVYAYMLDYGVALENPSLIMVIGMTSQTPNVWSLSLLLAVE
ncbi:jg6731, partial [Pararge aegeria aegeria]